MPNDPQGSDILLDMVRMGYATMVCAAHKKPVKYKKRPTLGCKQCCADRVEANRIAVESYIANRKK